MFPGEACKQISYLAIVDVDGNAHDAMLRPAGARDATAQSDGSVHH